MTKLSLATSRASSPLLARALAGLVLVGAFALWLWALPSLLARDGFVLRDETACETKAYRDPVTGRFRPAPSPRLATTAHCPAYSDGGTS
ncbi:MAG: hypothetical protein Q8S58_08165 [Bosea sp. (in: a-proteobacteria)]|uniref:hypothetical protein n=1 Tax=Bosea sp. (in: a-proteobacteria) TaxID=1871050 RepID=UPI002736883B|nr:hypothetical protein [Bosea sp. (in: a-proteobacteria)]MDP3255294.1 hypothetical protein [Bosea sp. (in: a-proteobacteria)]MDP3319092.1 hypothetical protein [Bosea sp. (in: a-proteobacteria)]